MLLIHHHVTVLNDDATPDRLKNCILNEEEKIKESVIDLVHRLGCQRIFRKQDRKLRIY